MPMSAGICTEPRAQWSSAGASDRLAGTSLRRSRGERNGGGINELAGKTLDQLA